MGSVEVVRTISAIISAGLLVITVAIALFAISLAGRGFGFAEYAQFVALAVVFWGFANLSLQLGRA
jgi:branched-subunit amino acid transport protein AzlD